jgi:uncharacterized protein (DUF1501 family)
MGGAVRGGDLYGNFPQFGTADAKSMFSSPKRDRKRRDAARDLGRSVRRHARPLIRPE